MDSVTTCHESKHCSLQLCLRVTVWLWALLMSSSIYCDMIVDSHKSVRLHSPFTRWRGDHTRTYNTWRWLLYVADRLINCCIISLYFTAQTTQLPIASVSAVNIAYTSVVAYLNSSFFHTVIVTLLHCDTCTLGGLDTIRALKHRRAASTLLRVPTTKRLMKSTLALTHCIYL